MYVSHTDVYLSHSFSPSLKNNEKMSSDEGKKKLNSVLEISISKTLSHPQVVKSLLLETDMKINHCYIIY